jgi:ribulose-phosphate 3-epimerase
MVKIAASILAADMMHLSRDVHSMEDAGCDMFHIDVMDGIFVPNIAHGPALVSAMKKKTYLPLDVHLMIIRPERYIDRFIEAGADFLTVHYESVADMGLTLARIREAGIAAGVSLKPGTDAETLKPYLDELDMVLVMTVEPGYGGQRFMSDMLGKVKALRDMGYTGLIETDGGLNQENLPALVKAGIDIAVLGTSLFEARDKSAFIETLRRA